MGPGEPHHDSRLPIELYRLIVSEVKDRRDVFRLLTVSRAFNYEAERVLYRKISINPHTYRYRKFPLQSKSSRQRSACHLHSLEVALFGYSNLVVQILKSVPNLKSLSFDYHYRTKKNITLPKKPPFQLLKLQTNGPADSGLKAFLETQRELTTLICNPSSIDRGLFVPMDFLPSLENISSSGGGISLIHGSGVKRVCFRNTVRYLERMLGSDLSVGSVRSLFIPCDFNDNFSLRNIFPNLEYLDGLDFPPSLDNIQFGKFARLRKLKVTWFPDGHYEDKCALLASQLFRHQTTLQSLEITKVLTGKAWTMQRGADPIVVEECHLVKDEWMNW